jgi:competence ComEA-like helix-hairpin-helix protein
MKTTKLLRIIIAAGIAALTSATAAERPDKKTTQRPTERQTAAASKIDINTADLSALESLPGVGPQTARAIVAERPFTSVNDLERVQGIGPQRMRELRDMVTASRPAATTKASRGRVDLNTADVATLESLPGVGPEIAQAIVAARPFKSTSELESVRGIGPARMKELQGLVTVSRVDSSDGRTTRSNTPRRVQDEPRTSRQPASTEAHPRINLNTASLEELESLPEIGPVKAQAIIDERPFSSIEDVMRVKGIKEGTFEVIRDKITVR